MPGYRIAGNFDPCLAYFALPILRMEVAYDACRVYMPVLQ